MTDTSMNALVGMHSKPDAYRNILDMFTDSATPLDARERRIFPKVVAGYKKFLGKAHATWFEPPERQWPLCGLAVKVSPEVGLLIGGRPHAIKLYFRGEPPSADRIRLTTAILDGALSSTWPGTVFAILDVRRARLYAHQPSADTMVLLKAEAGCLAMLRSELQ